MELSFIATIITSLLGGGGITYLLFFRENKKERELDVIQRQMEIINACTAEISKVRQKLDVVNSENAVLKAFKCVNTYCTNRRPPIKHEESYEKNNGDNSSL